MPYRLNLLTVLMCAGLIMAPAYAAEDSESDVRKGRRGPPQASIDACVGKVAGDACTFVARNGNEMTGTCATPHGDTLSCKPEGH